MQNGITSVLPPKAAARVPLSKSSAMTMPGPLGWAKCTWLSMPPGSTSRPARVDHLVGRAQVLAERHDLAAADADVADDGVAGVGDAAAADDGVELAHQLPL